MEGDLSEESLESVAGGSYFGHYEKYLKTMANALTS